MTWIPDEALARLAHIVGFPAGIGARYDVGEVIGTGGMGSVYRARDRQLGRWVAIKVEHAPADPALAARIEAEARTIAALEHPSIVPVHEAGVLEDGRHFYVMKLVEGETLAQWSDGGASINDGVRMVMRLCEVLAFAHDRRVIHRDLKPSNVMVGRFGELFVMDWGISRHVGLDEGVVGTALASAPASPFPPRAARETRSGAVLGTPGYMAPEQASGSASAGPRADIFALGAILGFLARAAAQKAGAARRRQIPKRLRAIIGKASAPDPVHRYGSALALAADCRRYLDHEPLEACPDRLWAKVGRWLARNTFFLWLLLGYVLLRVVMHFLA